MKHGGDLTKAMQQFGGTPDDWLDLSTGINPTAYPAIEHINLRSLADLPAQSAEHALLKAAGRAYAVPSDIGIAAAPGTQAIITALPRVLAGKSIAIVGPTYASHEESWHTAGAQVEQVSAQNATNSTSTHLLLVNPNNPCGHIFTTDDLLSLARQKQKTGGYLIVDEAYMDLHPQSSILPHLSNLPILVLRSFGKFFGLAGLRLGFLIGPAEITDRLQQNLGSWAVSGPALDIGHKALADVGWQQNMRTQLRQQMQSFCITLQQMEVTVRGRTDLYLLIEHPKAHDLHKELAKQHIWTRVFDYSKTWIRLGLPKESAEQNYFCKTLQVALSKVEQC